MLSRILLGFTLIVLIAHNSLGAPRFGVPDREDSSSSFALRRGLRSPKSYLPNPRKRTIDEDFLLGNSGQVGREKNQYDVIYEATHGGGRGYGAMGAAHRARFGEAYPGGYNARNPYEPAAWERRSIPGLSSAYGSRSFDGGFDDYSDNVPTYSQDFV